MSEVEMLHDLSQDRMPVADSVFAQICRATPAEAVALAMDLPEGDRIRLALFCNARSHLREIGRAIAETCRVESMTLEAGLPGLALHQQSRLGPDTWGCSGGETRQAQKRIRARQLTH